MCMLNLFDFPGAVHNLSTVISMSDKPDVECIIERSYAYIYLRDINSARRDFEEAEMVDISLATSIQEYAQIARELSGNRTVYRF